MMVTLNFALGPTALERGISIDPSRLIQGLVGGIGFLGAGAILDSTSQEVLQNGCIIHGLAGREGAEADEADEPDLSKMRHSRQLWPRVLRA